MEIIGVSYRMEFPKTLVINLDDRPERWEEIQQSFSAWPPLERVSAVKDSPGWKGCAKSHVKCIKMAKERGYPWVVVLEDDCEAKPDSLEQFRELLPVLWKRKSEWDIFLGGCTNVRIIKQVEVEPPIFQITGLTTHFCLYNSDAYDKIIEQYNPKNDNNIIQIDLYYQKKLRMVCTTPFLAVQKPGVSDIEEESVDYLPHYTNAETTLNNFLESQKTVEGFSKDATIYNNKTLATNFTLTGVLIIVALISIRSMRKR